jgi:hypothetical protein
VVCFYLVTLQSWRVNVGDLNHYFGTNIEMDFEKSFHRFILTCSPRLLHTNVGYVYLLIRFYPRYAKCDRVLLSSSLEIDGTKKRIHGSACHPRNGCGAANTTVNGIRDGDIIVQPVGLLLSLEVM